MASRDEIVIRANAVEAPPPWALQQRRLIDLMNEATVFAAEKYARADGRPHNVQDADDAYEAHSYRGLLYALGGGKEVLDLAFRQWNAITRLYDDANSPREDEEVHPRYAVQLHREYYDASHNTPADWFHMGEGNQSFYSLALADPGNPEQIRRSRRFAAMYIGEDPQALNYDPEYRIIRSPFHGSCGPLFSADVEFVKRALDPVYYPGGKARGHAQRSNLYPIVDDLEADWFEDPMRCKEIVALFEKVVLNGDIPDNLAATGLVTHAFLHTGEEKYRRWVLDYTEAWMDRVRVNDGIIPDNVGPTGCIGEMRCGQWWGGWYGWNSRNSARNAFLAATIAAECALLLTGDFGYLELIRSQIQVLLDRAKRRKDGQLLVPTRYTRSGWEEWEPMHLQWLGRLYHASMDERDRELILHVRDGEREIDWNHVENAADRSSGNLEARFQYYEGLNPDWPLRRLEAEYLFVLAMYEHMRRDSRDTDTIVAESRWPPNPVVTKGLVQVTMGSPQPVYNGGLLRATVRYFDDETGRPGLPAGVAALVEGVSANNVQLHVTNMEFTKVRRLVVQAGAFGEHRFGEACWSEQDQSQLERHAGLWLREKYGWQVRTAMVDATRMVLELPPGSSIHLDLGLERFTNRPSYLLF